MLKLDNEPMSSRHAESHKHFHDIKLFTTSSHGGTQIRVEARSAITITGLEKNFRFSQISFYHRWYSVQVFARTLFEKGLMLKRNRRGNLIAHSTGGKTGNHDPENWSEIEPGKA